MDEKTYELDFTGYWREPNVGGLPPVSGVYCVFCLADCEDRDFFRLKCLAYIGEAGCIVECIKNHEKWRDWKSFCTPDEQICFSYAPVDPEDRKRVQAALIYKHKPRLNQDFIDSFPFPRTTILTKGINVLLKEEFTV